MLQILINTQALLPSVTGAFSYISACVSAKICSKINEMHLLYFLFHAFRYCVHIGGYVLKKFRIAVLCVLLICVLSILLTACNENDEIKSCKYNTEPETTVYYDNTTNTSTVMINLVTTNDGTVPITALKLSCFFIDSAGNKIDEKTEAFSVDLQANSIQYNVARTSFVFKNVKGKPSKVVVHSVIVTYGISETEERQQWLDENWWIWFIVAYVVVGIVIGILCGLYVGAEFGYFDEEFWMSLLCGLFWPIGGIVLLVIYIKEKKEDDGYYYEDCDDEDDYEDDDEFDDGYDDGYDDDSKGKNRNSERKKDKKSKEDKKIKREIPKIKMSDIAGLDEAKESFNDRVILPIKHKKLFAKYGKQVGGGILLYGLPGTGKTMFAQAVANELKASFFSVKCSDILSKWYGESESNVKELFAKARKEPISVIFFDEFEAIGAKRKESPFATNATTVQEILAQMQGVERSKNTLLVLAATNCPWNIDGALLRPGRFNEKIYVPLPDKEARLFILKKELSKISLAEDVSLDEIADRLDNYNGSDVSEFCEQCKLTVIKKELSKERAVLDREDLEAVLNKVHSSVLEEDVEKMEEFRENNNL